MRRPLPSLALLLPLLVAACASPWELGDRATPAETVTAPGACRVVATVTLEDGARQISAVLYLALDDDGDLRAHLDTESGLSLLDVAIDDGTAVVRGESALAGGGRLSVRVVEDLRRMFGDRSVFAARTASGARDVVAGPSAPDRIALPLPDGFWVAASRADLRPAARERHITLLAPDRVPLAELDYADTGAARFPRLVRVHDLRDGHVLDLEAAEVVPTPPAEPQSSR